MSKAKINPLPTLVENFFTQYLILERQLSPCTVASYTQHGHRLSF